MSNPTISVIVPVYNAENYVSRCIESVLDQTYCNWQMIIVDDGSKDKSLEICQKNADVDDRISVIIKKISKKQTQHFNRRIECRTRT